MKLNESQCDILGTIIALSLFWFVMSYFIVTQPNYLTKQKATQIEKKHVQSKVLDAYGKVLLKNFERCQQD
jgi:F0F1-type ATP synthase membrane subunit b/b'